MTFTDAAAKARTNQTWKFQQPGGEWVFVAQPDGTVDRREPTGHKPYTPTTADMAADDWDLV